MRLSSFAAKDANAKSAYIGSTCASNTYAKNNGAGNTSFIINAHLKCADPKNNDIKGADVEISYTDGNCSVQYSKIY